MRFFINTIDIEEITTLNRTGMLDGINTNPSILAKSKTPIKEVLKEISKIVMGPIAVEVTAPDFQGMMKEADALRKISRNILVKVPLSMDGLRVCKTLSSDGTLVAVTLCFDCTQAILAAKAGAKYVCPFIGRLEEQGGSGLELLKNIADIYNQYAEFDTQIMAASVHSKKHIVEIARQGANAVTLAPDLLLNLYENPLTAQGIESFKADWEKTGQSLL
ncbi:MAG: fructose-6-phosphate aldolase [Alphaproteobacteria bacterium]|nr:fructose-6-phosphate aldolase [Alphaproteobacteria bacterium]